MLTENVEALFELSPMQQGMLFHSLYALQSGIYVEQIMCRLTGLLDVPAFERAWEMVVAQHQILRTSFFWTDLERPMQVVHREAPLPFIQHDWRGIAANEQQARLETLIHADRKQGFEFSEPPLMRLILVRLAESSYQLIWSSHHILLDGWSQSLVLKEVCNAYQALAGGKEIQVEASRPFADYVNWLQQQDQSEAETFWRETLKGFSAPTTLGIDAAPGSVNHEQRYEEASTSLPPDTSAQLQSFARKHRLTTYTLVQAAWAMLLSRYSGAEDVVFGTTVSVRPPELEGIEATAGLFINTLPVRAQVSAHASLLSWLKQLQNQTVEARDFEHTPLVDIQQWSEVPRGQSLFESILVFENYPTNGSLWALGNDLETSDARSIVSRTNYPLTLLAMPGAELTLRLIYDGSLFDGGAIVCLLGHLCALLEGIIQGAELRLSDLGMLTSAELHQQLVEWNSTQAAYEDDLCIHQLFQQQATLTPDRIAIQFDNREISYGELNQKANGIAGHLRKLGVGPEKLVGIFVERSIEMVAGLLGILKAGSAYVPLDPAFPKERLAFMIQDSGVGVLLTQRKFVDDLPAHQAQVVCIDGDLGSSAPTNDENHPKLSTENLAYVIYTSGSTGRPKGVQIEHRALTNFLYSVRREPGLTTADVLLSVTTLSFDIAALELYLPLITGARLVIASRETASDGRQLKQLLADCRATVMQATPATWRMLIDAEWTGRKDLKILCGGEALSRELANQLLARSGSLWNMYGPTETTIWSSIHRIETEDGPVSIGRPIANTQMFILDQSLNPLPIGAPGELYIGGDGLARSYLNRAELTAEKFIPDPFSNQPGRRLYRTGDLARYLSNGDIECLGRADDQVKVRGFRIELGEIEAVLNQHPAVRQVVVIAREDRPGDKSLVAYFVSAHETELSVTELRDYIKGKLPDYMMPSAFVALEELPLTPNGKVNRRALPAPDFTANKDSYVPPRTKDEELLAGIWADVLRLETVGVEDNFFELGGHSLLATQVISRIRQTFQVQLPLRALFEAPTVAGLCENIASALHDGSAPLSPVIRPFSRNGSAPLSFGQQSFWFLNQLNPNTPLYNIYRAVRLRGVLKATALQQALNEIIARHEALRTTLASLDEEPVQLIAATWTLNLKIIDLSDTSASDQEAAAAQTLTEQAHVPFELTTGPLIRAVLIRLNDEEHILLLAMHHVVSDDWSMGILFNELSALYEDFASGRGSALPPLTIQYPDFAIWQRNWMQGDVLEKQLSYWKQRLGEAPPMLELPTDRPRPALPTYKGAREEIVLPAELIKKITAAGQNEGATLFMTLLAAFQNLLARYTGQNDIVVGSPIAGRNRAETEGLIGYFINTLVLRTDLSGNPTFNELLRRVRDVALGAYAHQDLPFERLVEELQPQRSLTQPPLFQVMFIFQNAPKANLRPIGLSITPEEVQGAPAPLDLTLELREMADGMHCWFEYKTELFDAMTITRMAGHFRLLLERVCENPAQTLSSLRLLTEEEQQQLFSAPSDSTDESTVGQCIHELFEAQVERTPTAVAVIHEKEKLTYAELNKRANHLAHHLRALGVGPEVLVGICMERSIEMVVGVLGILKAGGAYVPLDPAYPRERLKLMMDDANAPVMLTQQRHLALLPSASARMVCIDTDWDRIAECEGENPARVTTAENLAYVIYTSGSTGQPKGVMIQHSSLVNYTENAGIEFGLGHGDRVLQFASLNFDTSAEEIFPCLMRGAKLVLRTDEMPASVAGFLQLCRDWAITVVDLPTAYWHEMVAQIEAENLELPPSLRLVIIGGERALPERLAAWQKRFGSEVRLVNTYGPTEATIVATLWEPPSVPDDVDELREVPIGKPVQNVRTYVLDGYLQPVPSGVTGELHIGGSGLARGYLNRPELTAEKFIADPFSQRAGARLYKTGDLARYLPDGSIEYAGRIDHQVKIRGFRVELGEIEAALNQHPSVRESVVLAREDGSGIKRLVAYVVGNGSQRSGAGEMRDFLAEKLPDFMLPSASVWLDKLPLAPNGKLDRSALPAPGECSEEAFMPPQTPAEEMMAGIWAEVLEVKQVGRDDNFFALGGHSLLATRMISRVRQAFQVELSLRSLFEAPTVRGLAEIVESTWQTKSGPAGISISTVTRDGDLPLSFAQQRLWFVERLDPGSFVYNVNRAVRMNGRLNAGALEEALNNVARRHEILRTNFAEIEGAASQVIASERSLGLRLIDLSALPSEQRETEAKRLLKQTAELPFDLAKDPLLRVTLLRLKGQEHILLLTLHHIICDGWSMGILCEELNDFYAASLAGKVEAKPELSVQYADFACWQRQLLTGEVFETQLSYWKRQLKGVPAVLGLPTDRSRPAVQTFRGARESFVIPQNIAAELKSLSRHEGVTLFMMLLAAWQSLLHRYTGENDIVVGSPIAGRNSTESENLIGLFVNALALRTDLTGDPTFRELLGRVREVTLGAFANQDLPFEKLVEELQPQRNLSYNPIFQVVFALQNEPTPGLKLPGLDLSGVEMETTTAKFDLTLDIIENDAGLSCSLEYNSDLFNADRISRMIGHFQTMLAGIVSNPAQRVSLLPLLTEAERHQLLVEWNDTDSDYPRDLCVHELFAAQAKQSPDAVALIFGNRTFTYDELDRRSNQLANYLRRLGAGREALVGICMERSVELLIGLLGIIKTGAAYVPLDAAYPQERLSFMLEDAGTTIVLTQQELAGRLPQRDAKVVCLDTDWQTIAAESEENSVCNTTPDDLIYIMYTSGSTGTPKGVAVTHRNVVRLVKQTNYAKFDAAEVFLQLAPISFDASTFEIWGSLLNGARLAIMPPGTPSLDELGNAITDYGVTTLWLTAGLFHLMVDNRVDDLRRVRQLLAGGDVLSVAHVQKLMREPGECRLINGYGPTEGTTFTCFYLLPPNEKPGDSVPIGRPIANTKVYLLDAHLQPVPVGVPGEIYIGGNGVARGYFNCPELTGERFITNPFSDQKESRLYKTGDLACYRADGNIEFLGRSDQQVKLRGFRIELGEVETALSQHPSVQTNVTIAREDGPGDKRLVAYLVGTNKPEIDTGELRRYLKQKLPDYMVPSAFIVLPELPLSPNGKVDRNALPPPGDLRSELEKTFVAPRDDLEIRLARIWEKVLALRPIGVRDNFFELGGHSLLAVRLFAQIEKAFGRKLPLAILFQAPTVEHLANAIRKQESSRAWSALVPIQPHGSSQPFFGVHAVGGNVLEYHDLARHLGSDQPFYGLQSQGLDGKQPPLTRIEEMAACYIKEVRKLQPEGPYAIGGRSFGGIVAFEMACQLHAQGQEVNLLALLDTYPAGYFKLAPGASSRRNRIARFLRRMHCHLQNLRRLPAREKAGYIATKGQYIPAKLQRMAWESVFSLYKRIARPLPRVLRNIEQLNYTAISEYVPQVYPGAVTLFLASGDVTAAYDLKEGWQALATGGVEIHEIEGNHINIIKEPFVGELAAKLGACIAEKSRKGSRDLEVAA